MLGNKLGEASPVAFRAETEKALRRCSQQVVKAFVVQCWGISWGSISSCVQSRNREGIEETQPTSGERFSEDLPNSFKVGSDREGIGKKQPIVQVSCFTAIVILQLEQET